VKGPGKGLGVDRQGRGATGLEGWKRRVWLGKETERIRKWIGRSGAEKEKHLSQIEKKTKGGNPITTLFSGGSRILARGGGLSSMG